jgi:bifunctional DNase/RNase
MAKNDKGKGAGEPPKPAGEKEVRICSLATTVNECIIMLEETTGNRVLPIWIGIAEGQAIAIRFSGIVLPRPLTHDLLLAAIQQLGFAVKKVVVSDIKENTFYARVHVGDGKRSETLDSRPSDAIAIAVRAGCPIFVDESVFERCQTLTKPITEDEVEKFKEDLKSLRPEDIFKAAPGTGPTPPGAPPPNPKEPKEKDKKEKEDDEP